MDSKGRVPVSWCGTMGVVILFLIYCGTLPRVPGIAPPEVQLPSNQDQGFETLKVECRDRELSLEAEQAAWRTAYLGCVTTGCCCSASSTCLAGLSAPGVWETVIGPSDRLGVNGFLPYLPTLQAVRFVVAGMAILMSATAGGVSALLLGLAMVNRVDAIATTLARVRRAMYRAAAGWPTSTAKVELLDDMADACSDKAYLEAELAKKKDAESNQLTDYVTGAKLKQALRERVDDAKAKIARVCSAADAGNADCSRWKRVLELASSLLPSIQDGIAQLTTQQKTELAEIDRLYLGGDPDGGARNGGASVPGLDGGLQQDGGPYDAVGRHDAGSARALVPAAMQPVHAPLTETWIPHGGRTQSRPLPGMTVPGWYEILVEGSVTVEPSGNPDGPGPYWVALQAITNNNCRSNLLEVTQGPGSGYPIRLFMSCPVRQGSMPVLYEVLAPRCNAPPGPGRCVLKGFNIVTTRVADLGP